MEMASDHPGHRADHGINNFPKGRQGPLGSAPSDLSQRHGSDIRFLPAYSKPSGDVNVPGIHTAGSSSPRPTPGSGFQFAEMPVHEMSLGSHEPAPRFFDEGLGVQFGAQPNGSHSSNAANPTAAAGVAYLETFISQVLKRSAELASESFGNAKKLCNYGIPVLAVRALFDENERAQDAAATALANLAAHEDCRGVLIQLRVINALVEACSQSNEQPRSLFRRAVFSTLARLCSQENVAIEAAAMQAQSSHTGTNDAVQSVGTVQLLIQDGLQCEDDMVCEAAAVAATSIYSHESVFAKCSQSDLVQNLISALNRLTSGSEATLAALCSFVSCLAESDEGRECLMLHGVSKTIVQVLSSSTSSKVLSALCCAVANLSLKHDIRRKLGEGGAGVVRPLVWLVHRVTEDEEVLSNACGALSNVCYHDDTNRGTAVELGVLEVLLRLCEDGRGMAVADSAIQTLRQLVYGKAAYRRRLLSSQAVSVLVRCAATSTSSSTVIAALSILRKLATDPSGGQLLLSCGAVAAVDRCCPDAYIMPSFSQFSDGVANEDDKGGANLSTGKEAVQRELCRSATALLNALDKSYPMHPVFSCAEGATRFHEDSRFLQGDSMSTSTDAATPTVALLAIAGMSALEAKQRSRNPHALSLKRGVDADQFGPRDVAMMHDWIHSQPGILLSGLWASDGVSSTSSVQSFLSAAQADVVVVYYTGHTEGMSASWLLSDGQTLSLWDLIQHFRSKVPQAHGNGATPARKRLLIVLDCPNSGRWVNLLSGVGQETLGCEVAIQASCGEGSNGLAAQPSGSPFTKLWTSQPLAHGSMQPSTVPPLGDERPCFVASWDTLSNRRALMPLTATSQQFDQESFLWGKQYAECMKNYRNLT